MKLGHRSLGPLFQGRGVAEFLSVAKRTHAKTWGHLFQPIVGPRAGAILRYEALLRPATLHSAFDTQASE